MQSYAMLIMCYSNQTQRTEVLSQTFAVLIAEVPLQKVLCKHESYFMSSL